MLYIGYPVCLKEAYRIFGQTIGLEGNRFIDYEKLSKYLKPFGLDIYDTSKGQYIVGLKIDEFGNMWDKFTNVDDSIILLLKYKKEFKDKMILHEADISNVTIEFMECSKEDIITIHNPEPYVINWGN
jgi:hypothetical protein